MPWAASPASAKRGATKSRASVRPSGKARRSPVDPERRRACGRSAAPVLLRRSDRRRQPGARRRPSRSVQTSEERLPLSGRMAKGPAGRKCSSAQPLCGRSCVDGGDDARLAVIPVHRLDAGHVAQLRAHAVAGDQQPCLDSAAIGERQTPRSASLVVKPVALRPWRMVDAEPLAGAAQRADHHCVRRPCERRARRRRLRRRRSGKPAAPGRRCANR